VCIFKEEEAGSQGGSAFLFVDYNYEEQKSDPTFVESLKLYKCWVEITNKDNKLNQISVTLVCCDFSKLNR
jgi:hypothetical protein